MHATSDKDVDHPHNNKLQAPSDFRGPNSANRKMTDVFFTLLLIVTWVCTTSIGIDAIAEGNVARLINGVDYDGRICGVDSAVEDRSKLYYLNSDSGKRPYTVQIFSAGANLF